MGAFDMSLEQVNSGILGNRKRPAPVPQVAGSAAASAPVLASQSASNAAPGGISLGRSPAPTIYGNGGLPAPVVQQGIDTMRSQLSTGPVPAAPQPTDPNPEPAQMVIDGVKYGPAPTKTLNPLTAMAQGYGATASMVGSTLAPAPFDSRSAARLEANRSGLNTEAATAPVAPAASGAVKPAAPAGAGIRAKSQAAPASIQPAAPAAGAPQGIASTMSDAKLRQGVRSQDLGIGDFQSGTGAIVGSDGKVTRIDSRPLPGSAQPQQPPGGESILAQATRLSRSSNANDRVLGAKLFRHGDNNQLKQAQAQGIMAQTESAQMLADIQKKALAGDPQAMASYKALTQKGGTDYKDRYITLPNRKVYNDMGQIVGEESGGLFDAATGKPVDSGAGGQKQQQQAVPPADKREVGKTYQTPKGPLIWRGNGWEAA